jgi:hypothetical protein
MLDPSSPHRLYNASMVLDYSAYFYHSKILSLVIELELFAYEMKQKYFIN